MNSLRLLSLTTIACLSIGLAAAQGNPAGQGNPAAPGAGAPSARGSGMGMRAGRWGPDVTPGWALMTDAERVEHQARMRAMKTYAECKLFQAEHYNQLTERAKAQGKQLPPMGSGRRDPCAGLPQ